MFTAVPNRAVRTQTVRSGPVRCTTHKHDNSPVQDTTISLQRREKVGSTVACTEVAIDLEVTLRV